MISTGPGSTLKEDITPVLSVLYNFAKALRPVRKFLKATILPPLQASDLKVGITVSVSRLKQHDHDLFHLLVKMPMMMALPQAKPEDGNSLKSRLVSLLTNTSGDISTMVVSSTVFVNVFFIIKVISAGGRVALRPLQGERGATD